MHTYRSLVDKPADKRTIVVDSQGKEITTDTCATGQELQSTPIPYQSVLSTAEASETSGIAAILEQREARYGGFKSNSIVAQQLKTVLQTHPKWPELAPFHQEALHQILSKVSRAIFNPDYIDNWIDIAGYATLVSRELE